MRQILVDQHHCSLSHPNNPVVIALLAGYQLAIRYLAAHGVAFPDALVLLPGGLGRAHEAKERAMETDGNKRYIYHRR